MRFNDFVLMATDMSHLQRIMVLKSGKVLIRSILEIMV